MITRLDRLLEVLISLQTTESTIKVSSYAFIELQRELVYIFIGVEYKQYGDSMLLIEYKDIKLKIEIDE